MEWRVDGLPFKSDSKVLTFGQQTTLTTGKTPGLPTLVPGTHTVELIIRRPGGAVTLPPIVYTVSSAVQDKSPLVQTVTPSEISPGKEQELILEGRNLTAGTAVTFGLGVGIVQPLEALSAGRAKIKVFVAPTAKLGDRLAKAANLQGTNTGPGSIHIVTAPVVFEPKPLACTDINTIPHFEIILKAPFFYKIPTPEYKQEGGMIVPVGPKGDVTINVPTVDDFSVLRWTLPSYQYEYLEVRFFRPSSATPLVIRRIDGTSTSLPLSGDLLAELFEATKPSGHSGRRRPTSLTSGDIPYSIKTYSARVRSRAGSRATKSSTPRESPRGPTSPGRSPPSPSIPASSIRRNPVRTSSSSPSKRPLRTNGSSTSPTPSPGWIAPRPRRKPR